MTNILNYSDKALVNTNLSNADQNPIKCLKQPPTLVLQSSLLNKRADYSQLDDLLTKKVKTGSTSISENSSHQTSPTLYRNKSRLSEESFTDNESVQSGKQNILRVKDTPMSPASVSTSSFSPELQSSSPTRSDFSAQRPADYEYCQLQQALQILKRKLDLYQELIPLRETQTVAEIPVLQEPLYIPPLITAAPEPAKVQQPKEKTQKNKSKFKKEKENEDELEFSYGPVEFPFLSLSTPLQQCDLIPALTFNQMPVIPALSLQQPADSGELARTLSSLEKGVKAKKSQIPELVQESLSATRAGTQKSEVETAVPVKEKKSIKIDEIRRKLDKKDNKAKNLEYIKESKAQKKKRELEKEQEKELEREKERKLKVKQECDELYARPAYFTKKQTERRKNKWQIEQEEKFKGIQFQPPIFKEASDIFFGGIKKKSALTPVGPEYQVDVPMTLIRRKDAAPRKPQLKWDPSAHDETKLAKFFSNVKKLFNMHISEEAVVNIVIKNNNDLTKALEYIRANKTQCRKLLSVKPIVD